MGYASRWTDLRSFLKPILRSCVLVESHSYPCICLNKAVAPTARFSEGCVHTHLCPYSRAEPERAPTHCQNCHDISLVTRKEAQYEAGGWGVGYRLRQCIGLQPVWIGLHSQMFPVGHHQQPWKPLLPSAIWCGPLQSDSDCDSWGNLSHISHQHKAGVTANVKQSFSWINK